MKFTCSYLPRTTTQRWPSPSVSATAVICAGTPVSTSGRLNRIVSSGVARIEMSVTGQNRGSEVAVVTLTKATASWYLATTNSVRR